MKKISLTALAVILFATSCSDETTVFQETLQDDVVLETSEAKLESSINYDKAGVLDIYEDISASGKSARMPEDGEAGDYPLTLVAQVDPPSRSGSENLTASHVHVVDDFAYVSYNTVEDGYSGAIDIIYVNDPTNPRITSRLYYTNADINSIKYDNGFIYVAGGVDSETSVTATSNSFVAKIVVNNGRMDLSSGIAYGFQEGFNATDVVMMDANVLVTSGQNGFLTAYNKATVEMQKEAGFEDLRSVATSNGAIAVLDASSGVKILDDNFNITKEISITSDFGTNTKRTLDFSGDQIIVAEGSNGAGVYSASSGDFIEYIPILVNPEGVDEQDVVTNAVAINEDVILMANGGAGLCLSEDQGDNTDLVGIIELDASINYVASKGDYIFAAAGKDGLQIIKLNRPSESLVASCANVPLYLGNRNLTVNANEDLSYRGSKRFNRVNVNGELLLCGAWTVSNETNINDDAVFAMNGTYVVGRNNKRKNITVGKNATFIVEGNLTIYGDLILEEGATIEFLGTASVVNIFGNVQRDSSAVVSGTFDDVRNKF